MSSGALLAVIVGSILILAGLALVLLAALNVIKVAERGLRPAVVEAGVGWPDVAKEFIAWLRASLAKNLVPGFALVLVGTAIIIVALVVSASGS